MTMTETDIDYITVRMFIRLRPDDADLSSAQDAFEQFVPCADMPIYLSGVFNEPKPIVKGKDIDDPGA